MSVCIVKLEMLVSHVLRLRLGGLGTTYDVGLGLIGKRVVDFLLMLIELFFARCYGWVATSEKKSKIGDFTPTRSVWSKISGRRTRPPPIISARL